MAEVVARDEKFVRENEPREQALAEYEDDGDFMKMHFMSGSRSRARRSRCTRTASLRTSAAGRMCRRRGA